MFHYTLNTKTDKRTVTVRPPTIEIASSDIHNPNPHTGFSDYYCQKAGERIPYGLIEDTPKLAPFPNNRLLQTNN